MTNMLGTASLDLLESLFEPLVDTPFFVKDSALRYVAANRAMVELCGVGNREAMIGRTAHDMYLPAEADRYEFDERRVLAGERIVDRVERVRAARRGPAWLIISQTALTDSDGRAVGLVGVGRHLRHILANERKFAGFATALDHVRQGFGQPLNCREAARRAGFSVSQLEREFRKVLGVTPRLYHQRVRIEEALRLLRGDLSIAEIAYLAGFSDHSSFTRRFRAHTGLTPSDYRQRLHAADSR